MEDGTRACVVFIVNTLLSNLTIVCQEGGFNLDEAGEVERYGFTYLIFNEIARPCEFRFMEGLGGVVNNL